MVFALKTTYQNKYLRFRNEEIQTYGLLQASADKVTDSYAQFEFLNSNIYCGLVHIRCRYNNKYLVRWSSNHYWLTATADETNEDKNDWMCTLFERLDLNDGSTGTQRFRLKHVQLNHYACVWGAGVPFDACLFAATNDIDQSSLDIFTLVNLNKLHATLSKRVAFQGDNGKYLGAYMKDGLPYLQFSYENPMDPKVIHEMFATSQGITYIKSCYFGKFWRSDNKNWILANSDGPRVKNHGVKIDPAPSMFRTTPLDVNVIGLLNMKSTWHITRYTEPQNGFEDCLKAANPNVDSYARLKVIELGDDPISD